MNSPLAVKVTNLGRHWMVLWKRYPLCRGMVTYSIVWPCSSVVQQLLAGKYIHNYTKNVFNPKHVWSWRNYKNVTRRQVLLYISFDCADVMHICSLGQITHVSATSIYHKFHYKHHHIH